MHKNRVRTVLIPVVVAVSIVGGVVLGIMSERGRHFRALGTGWTSPITATPGGKSVLSGTNNKLGSAMMLVDRYYVDTVSMDSLIEAALPAILKDLDPHSVYIPASDLADVSESIEGEFDGVGVVFNMATDTIIVQNVVSGGPSDKQGIRAGDRIIKINDSIVAGQKINQNKIVKMLKGKRGTKVTLAVQRPGIADFVEFTVERGVIPMKSLDASFMIKPGIGYIKLSAFSRNSYTEVMSATKSLKSQGADRLIFDLRENVGGFLDQAIYIANQFLDSGKLIVYTEDRQQQRMMEYSDGEGKLRDMKLVMLIDEGSASSSEILAGAIQDNDRGLLIGRRTFGKGLIQRQFDFNDGSAIRLTVARYYTPTGRSIQKPYTLGDDASYARDIWDRYKHNELFTIDSIKFADSLKFTTPAGRTVYGGGGIMPDIFMPLDTTGITKYYRQINGRNILYRYTIDYSDRHRQELDKITTIPQLDAFFAADRRFFSDFVSYAARMGVTAGSAEVDKSRELITAYLKAYIGRNSRLEDTGFYSNIYVIDKTMLRAIDEVRNM